VAYVRYASVYRSFQDLDAFRDEVQRLQNEPAATCRQAAQTYPGQRQRHVMNNPSPDDVRHMARALRLAKRGLYTTDPNPRVGCVIVRDGQVVGEGWHRRAANRMRGACAGRSWPAGARRDGLCVAGALLPSRPYTACSEALVKAGIARVVAAMPDPNPRVASQGMPISKKPVSVSISACCRPSPSV